MNPTLHAARLGVTRGWVEFRQQLTSAQDMGFTVVSTAALVVVLYFQRDATLPGTGVSLAAATLPGLVGLMIPLNGLMGAVGALSVEREDGTLLRAKAVPQGMVGYLVGRIVMLSITTICSVAVMLTAGLFFVPGLLGIGAGGWLTLAWIALLGLLSSLPLGAIIGSLAKSPQSAAGLAMLAVGVLTSVSGIFYPITALAGWLQAVAHAFPLYWLGLGMRSALLPDAAAAAEIGGSWRPVETTLVLLVWAVAGLLLAPPILRRMARRESGSAMEERRHRAMQRVT
ncbi:ABC-2 type transport system permease protein [Nonomuraea thailandensis]|uniref:Transport permease protein n=1 Tax=Nonomuraea thailandensis TaxID=1188745 RepID=A0A9X2GKC4_9ACTN|nr:ABC transporter permease [Nonomuraea thailandensis]MCP2359360.1 ABC-2 type transport system permease protein [Nonomuraea thailandensis]